jgi:putative membrane protein
MSDNRTLILCVDRDDDIGYKGGIISPVIGRDDCLAAANTLGLVDPEDSDVNAIFQAVKTYDEQVKKGEDLGIAVISGNHMHRIEGDRKLAQELDTIIQDLGVSNCVLVTDGAEDEFILPIIQSKIPVISVQRVIVNQMPNLEGTYYIIRKFLDDPKIARVVLVPIGIAMLLYAISYILGYPEFATIIVVGVLGTYLLFKGFGIDEIFNYALRGLSSSFRGGRLTFVSYIAAIFIAVVGVVIGLSSVLKWYTVEGGLLYYFATFIYGSVAWFTMAGLIASLGKIIDTYLNEGEHLWKVIVLPFFICGIGIMAYGASIFTLSISGNLEFPILEDEGIRYIIISTVVGLVCAFFGVYVQRVTNRWYQAHPPLPQKNKY